MNLKLLQQSVEKHASEYGSLPFWSWNDALDPEELRRQIARMDELGMHGFFMHARGGLETEYLSEDWYRAVNACIDEAKKRGMEAWAYDENGWPSGFAGGILLQDEKNWAHYLSLREENVFPTDALAVFVADGDGYRRVTDAEAGAHYFIIDRKSDPTYVDTFDGRITTKFLENTHAQYQERLAAEDFGTHMPGFFTDEPQYYRYATPWSDTFPDVWREKHGTDVLDGLIALFRTYPGNEIFRYDYHLMMHEQFISNFVQIIYEWCEEHGCRLTGHAVEENTLYGQMWSCGGIMPFYRYEHIPGIDYLGRWLSDDVSSKQLGSVCAQLGKKKALSEMFACCGWDVTPTELKNIAELQYVNGVNVMCQHLYAYSIRGQRKRDYPANYSEHLPWQMDMAAFNRYFNRLGYLLSLGEEAVNTLVIHPIRSCYLTYKRDEDYASIAEIENAFHALSNLLSGHQIPYHWGDESMLRDLGRAENGKLILGRCAYSYVVIPDTKTLDGTTVELLRQYLAEGGKLWLYADVPERMDGRPADLSFLRANVSFEDLCEAAPVKVTVDGKKCSDLRQMVRQTDEGRIIYIVNRSNQRYPSVRVEISDCLGAVMYDLHTAQTEQISFSDGTVTIALEPAGSAVLVETQEKADRAPMPIGARIDLSGAVFRLAEPVENRITLDTAQLSRDGGTTYGELLPVMAIKDRLLRERYRGRVVLRYPFLLRDIPSELKAVLEPMRDMHIAVNGAPIEPGDGWLLDRSFRVAELTPYLRLGENELTVSFDYFQRDYVYYVLYGGVSETLRNCLWFDTEIECVTLVGDFAIFLDREKLQTAEHHAEIYTSTRFPLSAPRKTVALHDLVRDGYPFFAGTIKAETVLPWKKGDPDELWLPGRYATIHVAVNGEPVGMLLFTDHISLRGFLKEGENRLTLSLTNSNRNLLGPHHFPDPEPMGSGPTTFSCEGSFDEYGRSENYLADRYAFVRFGVDY